MRKTTSIATAAANGSQAPARRAWRQANASPIGIPIAIGSRSV